MSVNFEKHKADLLAAWKEVVDDKTATDWVLVGYESNGLSNDLKVVGKGDGGIDELKEEFNSGTIMYAFVRVLDPKTSLHKFVLINWQGEGAPINRKGSCAGHLREIANFFKGTHVTINARNEEEVDENEIIDKLSKSTSSSYSFKPRTEPVAPVKESVGAVYKKVIPKQEINSEERDKFWAAEEEAERQRQAEEARVRDEKQKLAELERHRREATEAALREEKSKEVENSIKNESVVPEKVVNQNIVKPRILEKESNTMSDKESEAKKSRNEEAKEVISTRTVNARAIFENAASNNSSPTRVVNTSVPKANLRPSNYTFDNSKEILNGAQNPSPVTNLQNGSSVSPSNPTNESQSSISVGEIVAQLKSSEKPAEPAPEVNLNSSNQSEVTDQNNLDAINKNDANNDAHEQPSGEPKDNLRAIALYDYQAADETEISFDPGDVITHIDQIDVGWWQGLSPDGSYGLFPANYVELLEQAQQ